MRVECDCGLLIPARVNTKEIICYTCTRRYELKDGVYVLKEKLSEPNKRTKRYCSTPSTPGDLTHRMHLSKNLYY